MLPGYDLYHKENGNQKINFVLFISQHRRIYQKNKFEHYLVTYKTQDSNF